MNQIKYKDVFYIDFIKTIKEVKVFETLDESFIDKFTYKYTTVIFYFCFLMHYAQQLLIEKSTIFCIFPSEISTDTVQAFSKHYCLSSNMYHVPSNHGLPNKGETREYKITYYQWVPWILIICSLLAATPVKIWLYLTKSSRFYIDQLIKNVDDAKKESNADKQKTFQNNINKLIEDFIEYSSTRNGLTSTNLTVSYIITRIFYLFNTFMIFMLLNLLLGQSFYVLYGFKVIKDIWNGKFHAMESQFFPRLTMCDVPIRSTGHNINWYVVQCALPINIFNEKIFLILWFWNAFVFVGTVISTFKWWMIHCVCTNNAFVKRYLKILNRRKYLKKESKAKTEIEDFNYKNDPNKLQFFVEDYLTRDGLFLLNIIETRGSNHIVCQTISYLWKAYSERDEDERFNEIKEA